MKRYLQVAMLVSVMTLAVLSNAVRAEEIPMVTGEQWIKSTEQVKKVYLTGIANAFQVETAYQAGNLPTDAQSIVPRFARGMKGETLDTVITGLDGWYARNPDRLRRPVIETIWFEMVVPGLQKNK